MSYTLSTFDDGQIVLFTMNSDFAVPDDLYAFAGECLPLLAAGPDRMVMIGDIREQKLDNLNLLLAGGGFVRSPEGSALFHHPKVIKQMAVTNSKVAQLASRGLNTASFGFADFVLVDTIEEALALARDLLYGQSKVS